MGSTPSSLPFALAATVLLGCGGMVADVPAAPAGETLALAAGGERRDVRFPCEGSECAAWLYRPAAPGRPPVVVMGHGFAGTRDVGLPYFAEQLAARGMAVVLFDYRTFGASGGGPRQLVDPWRQLEDWRAALVFARAQADLDGERVALFGSSLGAGHALITAADAGDVRAVVALAPLLDSDLEGEASFPGPAWAVRILFTAWGDLLASVAGRRVTLPSIAPPGDFGMIVDGAAYAAFEKLVEGGSTYRNEVLARSILTFDEYNPADRTGEIRAPVLLVAAPGDRFAPFEAARKYAAADQDVTLVEIPGDHFDAYSPPVREQAAESAARFLEERLR
jgi:pimeloyl-ACP methyl ester carboxylesterase